MRMFLRRYLSILKGLFSERVPKNGVPTGNADIVQQIGDIRKGSLTKLYINDIISTNSLFKQNKTKKHEKI